MINLRIVPGRGTKKSEDSPKPKITIRGRGVKQAVPDDSSPDEGVQEQKAATSALEIFRYEKQEVRTILRDGEPWFVAKDVAGVLEYSNSVDAVRRHCKHAELLRQRETRRLDINPRGITIIPEYDVYRLVMRSHLPEAEKFQDWVVEEVLPSIRKTGKYAPNALPDFSDPVAAARAWADAKESEIKALEEVKVLALRAAEDAPKVGFFDAVMSSKEGISFGQGAKVLNYVGIGQNRLFDFCRDIGLLQEHPRNIPYQKYIECRYFRVIEQSHARTDGVEFVTYKTLIFQQGLDYIRRKLDEHGYVHRESPTVLVSNEEDP